MSEVEFTDEIDRLGVAFHEAAHGLAGWLGGMRVHRMRIERRAWDGTVKCGVTFLDGPDPGDQAQKWDAFAVMLFAGAAAQLRFLDQAGVLTRRVHDHVVAGSSGDYEQWQEARPHCRLTESAARAAAEKFLDGRWERIDRVARRLAERLQLAGSAL